MLDYLELIGFVLLISTPFCYVLSFVSNILQIPFALINRFAVYVFFLLPSYIICLYFSTFTRLYCSTYELSAVPFIIVFSFAVFLMLCSRATKNDADDNASTYFIITAIWGVPAFIILCYVDTPFLQGLISIYMRFISFLLNLPVLGDILNFMIPLLSIVNAIWMIVCLVITVIATATTISKKFINKRSPVSSFCESAPVYPDNSEKQLSIEQILARRKQQCEMSVSSEQSEPSPRVINCAACGAVIEFSKDGAPGLCSVCLARKKAFESLKEDEPKAEVTKPESQRPQFCRKCGTKLYADSIFCDKCGEKILTEIE